MGRPERHDVDYFPFFVKSGKTLDFLELKYGPEGTGYFTNILRFLSQTPDHYYCVKEETDMMVFLSRIKSSDEKKTMDIIDIMVKTGKFDKELWEKHKVLASEAFLESLEEAYKYRNNRIITIDEIRAKFNNQQGNEVNQQENLHTEGFSPEIQEDNPQSKVDESKEKESKTNSGASAPSVCETSDPQKLFLHIWQHTPDVFNALARIESPKEWANFWENSGVTCEQVQAALDNFIADVRSGEIQNRYVPAMPDRFVLKGWITKCQKRFDSKSTGPPNKPQLNSKKSLL